MSTAGLVYRQAAFEVRTFRRNVAGAVFTVVFPIMFLLVFGSLNSGGKIDSRNGLPYIQFFVPGILAFGLIGACYTNMGMRISTLRDDGVLKRVRGTPLPTLIYLAGHLGLSITVTLALSVVTIGAGIVLFGVQIFAATFIGLLLALVVGAATFCALGLAISTIIPNGDAAAPIVQFSLWPFLFISNVFYPTDGMPNWLKTVARTFPIEKLADALQYAFNPSTKGPGIQRHDITGLAVWAVLGIVISARRFRWENAPGK